MVLKHVARRWCKTNSWIWCITILEQDLNGNNGGHGYECIIMAESPASLSQKLDMPNTHTHSTYTRQNHEQPHANTFHGQRNTHAYTQQQDANQGPNHDNAHTWWPRVRFDEHTQGHAYNTNYARGQDAYTHPRPSTARQNHMPGGSYNNYIYPPPPPKDTYDHYHPYMH